MDVDCVLVGFNVQRALARAVDSVRKASYAKGEVRLYYADLGSTDKSVPEALDMEGVAVIELDHPRPTPAMAVNMALAKGRAPLVQILRADSLMASEWLDTALAELGTGCGVLYGGRRRLGEPRSGYDTVADLVRNPPAGHMLDFDEEALVRRKCLDQAGEFDEDMALGWEAEFCARARRRGWEVRRLDAPMAGGPAAALDRRAYLAGLYRNRVGLAMAALRHFWDRPLVRAALGPAWRGLAGIVLALAGLAGLALALPGLAAALPLAALVLLFPRIWRWAEIMDDADTDEAGGKMLAWHVCAVGPMAALALFRVLAGILVRLPVRNRRGVPPARGLP